MAKLEREFSSGGIVARSRDSGARILLIKDSYGKWTWPKGKIEKGELPLDAAKREIREETGLKKLKYVARMGQIDYFYTRDKKRRFKTVYLYLFKSTGKEALVIQKSEIQNGRWLSEREALEKIGYKDAKKILRKAITSFKRHVSRAVFIAIFLLTLTAEAGFAATQPGTYDSRDWNAGTFEPGGGSGTAEGMRVMPYRIDTRAKPGREMLKKEKAWGYIGGIKERLLSGDYTGEILLRTKTDPKYNTLSDGIIYNTGGGRNYYVERKDGKHVILLDSPGGREEVRVTEANYYKFENAMHDDNGTPYVFFDQDGNEAAIVFVDWHTRVKQKFNTTGEVIIMLTGAPAARHRYR